MIKELKINNLAIIKDVELELSKGLSTLTGETGAGKSIILDGISLLTGSRANSSIIRRGEDKLRIEAIIELSENMKKNISAITDDIDLEDDELIIYREITSDAKSKISINGRRVTLGTLSSIMENIMDIVGQHENQYLLNKSYHLSLLDAFIDVNKYNLKEIVQSIKKIREDISLLENERKNTLEKKEYYEYIIEEIEENELYMGIEEDLEEKYNLYFNAGRIAETSNEIVYEFDEYILNSLNSVIRKLSSISDLSEDLSDQLDSLYTAQDILNDVYRNISFSDLDEDSEDLVGEISEKIDRINKLKNTLKEDSIEKIINLKEEYNSKLLRLELSTDELDKLKIKEKELIDLYEKQSRKLSDARKDMAKIIEKRIDKELLELNMKSSSFKVEFNTKSGINVKGNDDVQFLIRTNAGENYNKLDKIASGGEVSRIMLALKIVFSEVDDLGTLIFDEIDAGISGETVKMVAEKLKILSNNVQVICVTHSPNIAAKSNEQFLIYKIQEEDKTTTKIKKLNEEERVEEIARIISGNTVSDELRKHIRDMMKG